MFPTLMLLNLKLSGIWLNEAYTSIELHENVDSYLMCVEMHVWQKLADAFGPFLSI